LRDDFPKQLATH